MCLTLSFPVCGVYKRLKLTIFHIYLFDQFTQSYNSFVLTCISGYGMLIIMIKVIDCIHVGVKEEYERAIGCGVKVVCALNRAAGFVTHQSVVGWEGRGCDKRNPYYLYKRRDDGIYLNMIDGDDPKYVSDIMVNAALLYIWQMVQEGEDVFIYCSMGVSRAPSIALMYMLENGLIERSEDTVRIFKRDFYRGYRPKMGNLLYIKRRWNVS